MAKQKKEPKEWVPGTKVQAKIYGVPSSYIVDGTPVKCRKNLPGDEKRKGQPTTTNFIIKEMARRINNFYGSSYQRTVFYSLEGNKEELARMSPSEPLNI